jgi:hypothetical protein
VGSKVWTPRLWAYKIVGWIRKRFDRDRLKFERFEQVRRDVEKFDEVRTVSSEFDDVFGDEMMSRKVLER